VLLCGIVIFFYIFRLLLCSLWGASTRHASMPLAGSCARDSTVAILVCSGLRIPEAPDFYPNMFSRAPHLHQGGIMVSLLLPARVQSPLPHCFWVDVSCAPVSFASISPGCLVRRTQSFPKFPEVLESNFPTGPFSWG